MSLQDFLPKKPYQRKPSKEEKIETKRLQTIVRDQIYPLLLENAKNIKDAKNILKNLVVGLDAVFYQDAKQYQEKRSSDLLSTLELTKAMNAGKETTTEFALVELLKDEKISTSKALIEGLEKELDRLTDKELINRPLSELKTEFL